MQHVVVQPGWGLGDTLSNYWCRINYNQLNLNNIKLTQLYHAVKDNKATAYYLYGKDPWVNALGWITHVETKPANSVLLQQADLSKYPIYPIIELPTEPIATPKHYIHYSPAASVYDRHITDYTVLDHIKTMLPVMITDTGITTMTQFFYVAKHAAVIVSAPSCPRTFSQLFGVPVIEVLQEDRITNEALTRTIREYRNHEYGMSDHLNYYYLYPSQKTQLLDHISSLVMHKTALR